MSETPPAEKAPRRRKSGDEWKRLLDPWGDRYAELVIDLEAHCESLDEDALVALREASRRVSTSNIYWGSYGVAHLVWEAVKQETYRRSKTEETRPIPPAGD